MRESGFRAGAGSAEITPGAGARLVGYADRSERSRGCRDPLCARALMLEAGGTRVAFVAVELCYVGEDVVAEARTAAARATDVAADHVLIAATHTHSGPHDADAAIWPGGLAAPVADAVVEAAGRLEPATVDAGWGMLHGHSVNRRRLEDPVDPAVGVVRVDAEGGRPIGVLFTFGCHPVVLGPDNLLASGDWPGHASRSLEAYLGGESVALFVQGGGADVNPLPVAADAGVLPGTGLAANAPGSSYYGHDGSARRLTDRTGGSGEQLTALGDAVAEEVRRVHAGIRPMTSSQLRVTRMPIDPGPPPGPGPEPAHVLERPRADPETPLEVMLIGISDAGILIVGQPGEVFAESSVALRRAVRRRGVPFPLPVACANGWRGYLPPIGAYDEGGYEVDWARAVGIGEKLQADVLAATLDVAGPLVV